MSDFSGSMLFDEPALRAGAGLPLADVGSLVADYVLAWGAFNENRPRATLPRDYSGALLRSYADDYYNRFWILPPVVALGSVSADTAMLIRVWNAHLVSATIDSWVKEGQLNGVQLLESHPHPRVLTPLAIEGYTLSVLGEGEAAINGRIRFVTSEEEPLLNITGQRAVLWDTPLWPNWDRTPVVVKYEFLTEILTSRDGSEQRIQKRKLPRKTLEFEVRALDTPVAQNHRQMRMMMQAQQNKTFVVPEWTRRVYLANPVGVNEQQATLAYVPQWLYPGRQVCLSNGGQADLVTIDTTDPLTGVVTFSTYLSREWGRDACMMPALSCYMPDTLRGTLHLPHASTHQVTFTQFPTSESEEAFAGDAPMTMLDGREVFTRRPNWRVDLALEEMWPVETVSFDSGPIERFRVIGFPTRVTKFSLMSKSQAEAEDILRFFLRKAGRAKEFWFPSQEDDFELKEASPAGLNTARVGGLDVLQLDSLTNGSLRGVEFLQENGERIFMKIISVSLRSDSFGSDTLITFSEALPSNVGPGYTKRVSWLHLARFAVDSIAFAYETPWVAQIEAAIQTLPYAEAE